MTNFGYNYQAHMFNGTYDSVDRVLDNKYWGQTGDFVDDKLMMKWSDDWLATWTATAMVYWIEAWSMAT